MDTNETIELRNADERAAEITKVLTRKFPAEAIKQRKGGMGSTFDYIEGQTAVRRMIEATGNQYSFQILDKEITDWGKTSKGDPQMLITVHARLTINGLGFRENYGVQLVNVKGGEDLFKGAATDAFKRCAMMFGMALDLYGKDYENPEPLPVSAATKRRLAAIYETVTKQKMTKDVVENETQLRYNKDVTDLTEDEAKEWIGELEKQETKPF